MTSDGDKFEIDVDFGKCIRCYSFAELKEAVNGIGLSKCIIIVEEAGRKILEATVGPENPDYYYEYDEDMKSGIFSGILILGCFELAKYSKYLLHFAETLPLFMVVRKTDIVRTYERVDNDGFNQARGKRMFLQGLPEPENPGASGDAVKFAVWQGYVDARTALKKPRRVKRNEN